jgi:uncharacterized protein (DUF302 family)
MYTFETRLQLPVEQAIPQVLEQLKLEGFGVLMDLDTQATMKQKIGADIPAYHILGAFWFVAIAMFASGVVLWWLGEETHPSLNPM